jgi:hypothetical protein
MSYNLAAVRELIEAAFGDEELNSFCFDHFPDVYRQFTAGQIKGARVRMIVEYAQRQGLVGHLLKEIRLANPHQYANYAPRLRTAVPPRSFIQKSVTTIVISILVTGFVGYIAFWLAGNNQFPFLSGEPTPAIQAATATTMPTTRPIVTPTITGTASPGPLYQSGLITYIQADENGKTLYALQKDGLSIPLTPRLADLIILAIAPENYDYLAVAISETGLLTYDDLYGRFVSGEGVKLIVVSSDGQETHTVIENESFIDARYTADEQLIVAVMQNDTITYSLAQKDGTGLTDLHTSTNLFAEDTPAVEEAPVAVTRAEPVEEEAAPDQTEEPVEEEVSPAPTEGP